MTNDIAMLLYFWEEKGDVKRYVGYSEWAASNRKAAKRLEKLISNVELAKVEVSEYIRRLA